MASVEEPMQVPHKADKIKQFESMLGILGSNSNSITSSINKFDDFQLTLFDLISNASEEGILQCFNQKSTDIYRFLLTLFIASLHKDNPLRLANDNTSQSKLLSTPPNGVKKRGNSNENPLNSVLVSPANTLPPPPKRKNSEKKEEPKPEPKAPELPSDPNKNNNIGGIGDVDDMLQRHLSDIDEMKEKDKYVLEKELKRKQEKEKDSIFNSDIIPPTSDDKLLVTQASVRNKNLFGDIMLTDNDETDNEFSKTYETYNGDEFFAQRTITTREHTTTEKFKCNPKEKAIVDEWRVLLHDIKPNLNININNNGLTPTPQPEQQMDELIPPVTDEQIESIEDDEAVMVKSGMLTFLFSINCARIEIY